MADLLSSGLSAEVPLAVPTPKPPAHYFASIVASITSQQISIKAADAVLGRIKVTLGTITPERVLEHDFDTLKACGLSAQKTKYIRHNAEVWHTLPIKHFKHMDDEAVIAELVKLYGIGRWTAEMFLMFSLARPDVFSRGDLGLMQSIYHHYPHLAPTLHHPSHPPRTELGESTQKPKPVLSKEQLRELDALITSWSPHRTTAALALWFHKDNGPVLL
jgi:3-methyladenine DNA glycosylase/8-oxoguanine DNA glycosylase